MKIVAVTSCPTGIAHTYMAAESLEEAAKEAGHSIAVETQGAAGANPLTNEQIAQGNANKVWVIPSEFSQALANVASRFADGVPATAKPRPSHSMADIDARAAADAEEAARAAREATQQAESATQPGAGEHAPPPPPEPAS